MLEASNDELSDLSDEDEVIDVAFIPPVEQAAAETDEDSDLSDAETTGNVAHLPRRILRSHAGISTDSKGDVEGKHKKVIGAKKTCG